MWRLSLVLLLTLPAWGAQVFLDDGRVIEGEVLSNHDAEQIDVEITGGGIRAVLHFDREEVVRIVDARSARSHAILSVEGEYADLGPAPTADQVWELAERLDELGAPLAFKAMAERVIAIDSDHGAAREALGYRRFEDEWMKPHEIARAKGLVRFEGRWLTQEAYEERLEQLEAERQRRHEERMAREERRHERRLARIESRAAYDYATAAHVYRPPAISSGSVLPSLVLHHGTTTLGGLHGFHGLHSAHDFHHHLRHSDHHGHRVPRTTHADGLRLHFGRHTGHGSVHGSLSFPLSRTGVAAASIIGHNFGSGFGFHSGFHHHQQ